MTTATVDVVLAARAPVAGELAIAELLASVPNPNGDYNCDGTRDAADDELVELTNVSGDALDLSGVSLWDANRFGAAAPGTPRFTFGAKVLGPGESLVVFGGGGGGGGAGAWCAALAQADVLYSAATLSLNDDMDTVTITTQADNSSTVVTSATWVAAASPAQAIVRSPTLTSPLVLHQDVPGHATDRDATPGTRADGAAFADAVP